ncbi:MAG TPA: NAD(P)-dependent oxidoreductase [Solirubrobacteraceae bacterium]|nr:NAD(P)-dependent oxidoreductase [Solirubrobacteraceae bacterium]
MAGKETIAVLGAGGTMGFAMARNLARAGFDVRAWNRSKDKAQPLTDDGAQVLDSPAEAATGAQVVLTILADADAVLQSMDGDQGALSAELGAEALWLQMSTIGQEGTERCADLAHEHHLEFVDAPVLGTKQPAEQGKLVILASGPERLHDRLAPIFDVLGQRTMWLGGAGDGSKLKLVTNAWLVSIVEGAAEALALAEGEGLDPQLLLDAVEGGPLDLPYLRLKAKAVMDRDFTPSFTLKLAAKDAGLAEAAAARHDLDLPVVSAIRRRMEEGIPQHGDKDMIATFLTSAPARATA